MAELARMEPKQVSIDPARLQELMDAGRTREEAVKLILAEQEPPAPDDPQPLDLAGELPGDMPPPPPDDWPEDYTATPPASAAPSPAAQASAPSPAPAFIDTFGACVLRAVMDGRPVNGHLDRLPGDLRDVAAALENTPRGGDLRAKALAAELGKLAGGAAILAAVNAADPGADLDKLLAELPQEAPEPGTAIMPALPEAAWIDPALGAGVAGWLDRYIEFSRRWSPRAFDGFHAACGLWLLSTVAARRVRVHMGKERYTNLYIALTARTSLYAKSTTAEIALQTLDRAGLTWLLAADSATPQKFIADLTTRLIQGYENLTDEEKDIARKRVGMAGQRGWYYDEFGQHVAAMMREGGFMADFRGLLRRMDDTPSRYETGTIGRGSDIVERPYLALLANLTPSDLRPFARRGAGLWGDGFLARFALITPPEGELQTDRFPRGERVIPGDLLTPLINWHNRLGLPDVELIDELNDKGESTGDKHLEIHPRPPETLDVTAEVYEAFYAYDDGLRSLLAGNANQDLDGNYARLAEKALRIAALLASLDEAGAVTLPYWARAQAVAEDWRAGLHRLYSQINQPVQSQEGENEEKILALIQRHKEPTRRELAQYSRLSYGDIDLALKELIRAGLVEEVKAGKTKRYTFSRESVDA